jgi:hypothetical protein
MLLSHTAGTSQSAYFGFTPDVKDLPTVLEVLSGAPKAQSNPVFVNADPGKGFQYSGGGSMIVQLAIMDLTGEDFPAYIQKKIFEPLGMQSSYFLQPLPDSLQKRAAWGYSAASWYKGMPYVYPQLAAAGLYTHAADLSKLIIDLQLCQEGKGKLLGMAMAREMMMPIGQVSDGTYKEQTGMGVFLLEQSQNASTQGRYFEHQGANAGFIAFAMGSVTGGNGVVIMVNSGDDFNGFCAELRRAVASVYGWKKFLPEPVKAIALDQSTLKSYEGRYRMGADEVIELRREGTFLWETINGGKPILVAMTAKDSLVFTDYNVRGFFTRNKNGAVEGLQNIWQEKPMKRMAPDEYTPSELIVAKRYAEAKEGLRTMQMNENAITYFAYNLYNKPTPDLKAVEMVLELAREQHPKSSMVYARWGDYHLALGNRTEALKNYQQALMLDPQNAELKATVQQLSK